MIELSKDIYVMALNGTIDINLNENLEFYSPQEKFVSENLSVYNDYNALFDPGANVCLMNDRYLFGSFRIISKKLRVKGVGSEEILCEGIGTLSGPLAEV